MARKDLLILAVGLAAAAGCASQRTGGMITVKGMTGQQVRAVAGTPHRPAASCWLYSASRTGTSIDGMRFCFTNGRVSLIQAAEGVSAFTSERKQARLALVRVALASGSGILVPFRPARVGRKRCLIPRGGPTLTFVRGKCDTRVVHRRGEDVVIFSESWNAHDFSGRGERFRPPGSRLRLQTSWLITVTTAGRIGVTTIRGDFPPQLVF
jgi:hypothetical protein